MLRLHYKVFHSLVPDDEHDDEIAIVTKRVMPVCKDGTCSIDKDVGKDTRNRRRLCVYCSQDFLLSHLCRDHLKPDSKSKYKLIPHEELKNLEMDEKKKKQWTSEAIKNSEATAVELRYNSDEYLFIYLEVSSHHEFQVRTVGQGYPGHPGG